MAAPERIDDLTGSPLPGAARLAWTKPGDGGSPLTGHQVRIDGRAWTDTGSAEAGFTWPGLVNGREYAFEARAVNADGQAPPSDVVRVTPAWPRTDTSNDVQTLLPPNATAMERALEQAASRASKVPVPIADVWNPATCPPSVLPWLAWALSVDRWDPDWPIATKRQVVADSIGVHRRKGTLAAVEQVLEDIGAVYDIEERPGGQAFRMAIAILNSGSILTEDIQGIREQIDGAKRRSVRYDLSLQAGASLAVAAAARVGAVQVADVTLEISA